MTHLRMKKREQTKNVKCAQTPSPAEDKAAGSGQPSFSSSLVFVAAGVK